MRRIECVNKPSPTLHISGPDENGEVVLELSSVDSTHSTRLVLERSEALTLSELLKACAMACPQLPEPVPEPAKPVAEPTRFWGGDGDDDGYDGLIK